MEINSEVLYAFGFSDKLKNVAQIGSGHINSTFLIEDVWQKKYILQEINTFVFKSPEIIAENISAVKAYLEQNFPEYLFPAPIPAIDGALIVKVNDKVWRLQPYIEHSIALDTLSAPLQAYEAARQFAKLTRLLDHFPTTAIKPTIEQFHDLTFRLEQFKNSFGSAETSRKLAAESAIVAAKNFYFIDDYFHSFLKRTDFPDRVMHHDTKISNVLLDKKTFTGICVIDLDTLMPGKFISDLGDMMRTYLCAFSENETDFSKITIRVEYFEEMIKGYLSELKDILTSTEKELILFSGKYIIYMQAVRFLTDYLNGDTYYPIHYPTHNLDRANNQFTLLRELFDKETILQDIINQHLA